MGGFDEEHTIVFIVERVAQAMKFDTREDAQTWAESHANCGYAFGPNFIIRETT